MTASKLLTFLVLNDILQSVILLFVFFLESKVMGKEFKSKEFKIDFRGMFSNDGFEAMADLTFEVTAVDEKSAICEAGRRIGIEFGAKVHVVGIVATEKST
jgi:hypothetical protein